MASRHSPPTACRHDRAAYLLARNGIVRRYPGIRFILSHAGGFGHPAGRGPTELGVPYLRAAVRHAAARAVFRLVQPQ